MQLAICSDVHDNVWNLGVALPAMQAADALICCGDLCSPFVVHLMAAAFPRDIHIVLGNNDGDLWRITQNAAQYGGRVHIEGEFADLPEEKFGAHIAVNHYPEMARAIAASRQFDVVCYGHDHRYHVGIEGDSGALLLNPGALMGWDPGRGREICPTFVMLDTASREARGYVVREVDGKRQVLPFLKAES